MKPEEQRIAIASQMPDGFLEGQRWLFNGQWIIFDPLNDLNAMREAIKEAHATLISIACHDGPGFPPGTCASMTGPILAKLQPFLTP